MKTTIKKQQSKIGAINASIKPYYSQSIGITPTVFRSESYCGNMSEDTKKQELYHYDGAGCTIPVGRCVCVYLLKATTRSTGEEYALGVYSKGEGKQMRAHAKRHTARTGEITSEMETFIAL